ELPCVKLDGLPRMADFARFAVACERGAGEKGQFLAAYTANQAGAHEQALEDSPLPSALVALLGIDDNWSGTPAQLLFQLAAHTTDPPPKDWPKKPNMLTGRLRRLAPNLRKACGLDVNCDFRASGRSRTRIITISRRPVGSRDSSSEPSESSETLD